MLTVLLSTRNRARLLQDVLESFCQLEPPPGGWKLVVVDNGSTDQTPQVIASFSSRLPLHSFAEPRLGKNFALNSGLRFIEGDLTVLTDDDVFPHPEWLVELRRSADTLPAYSMFGGAILPRWEAPPKPWLEWVDQRVVYSLTDPSLQEGQILPYLIFGPNMVLRAAIFRSGISFDSSIGPCGATYPMGSETELLMRLGREGHNAWHVPGAVVEHFIRKEQLDKAWALRRAISFGRGQYRLLAGEPATYAKLWMGTPRHLVRAVLGQAARVTAAGLSFRPEAVFRSRWRFNVLRGQVIEARILARERYAQAQSARANGSPDAHKASSAEASSRRATADGSVFVCESGSGTLWDHPPDST